MNEPSLLGEKDSFMDAIELRSRLSRSLSTIALLTIWCFFLWRASVVFAPNSNYVHFNSDGAIPILMANDERPITLFDYYYWGQDRWGAWPLLLARLFHKSANYQWSDQSIHDFRVVWLFLGVLVLAGLNRRASLATTLICLIAICLQPTIRLELFDISQVYLWQIPSLLLAWYSLKRLFGRELLRANPKALVLKRVSWSFCLIFFSFLAIWSSYASGPLLCFLVGLEALGAHLRSERETLVSWANRRYILGLLLVLVAISAELLLRIDYHRYGLKHYGADFKTPMHLDLGHLTSNLAFQVHSVRDFSWWLLVLVPLLMSIVFAGAAIYCWWKERAKALGKLREIFIKDNSILIIGTSGIAAINFVLIVLVDHVRLNFYDNRFTTLTFLFGSISGLFTLFSIFTFAVKGRRLAPYATTALLITGILFLTLRFPPQQYSPAYRAQNETALTLAQRAPRAILMGGYWETYVFAGLQRTNTMIPLPLEGHGGRMPIPWTSEMLREARQVVVEYRHSKFANADSMPATLTQYGNALRLVDPKWYENGDCAFALYFNETR
jgi:hypothetical protein